MSSSNYDMAKQEEISYAKRALLDIDDRGTVDGYHDEFYKGTEKWNGTVSAVIYWWENEQSCNEIQNEYLDYPYYM